MTDIVKTYWARIRQFSPNARLFLASAIITGAALGIYRLLFNFYVLSLNMDETVAGQLTSVNSTTALLLALPMGYLADLLGRKKSFIIGGALVSLAIAGMVLWPGKTMLFGMSVIIGAAQSLSMVSMSPFLLENSGVEERTYLFSLGAGAQMTASFVGNSIGGNLPTWIAARQGILPTSSAAYAGALALVAAVSLLGLVPYFFMRMPKLEHSERALFAPFAYAAKQPVLLTKLILPMLITSIGAGLLMPFMNIFFRVVYRQPDPVVGNLLAWGALAMGIGLIIAPPIADRTGKIQLVVITQGLSIPFLAMLGYSPWFAMSAFAYYVRIGLMNMSGPVYQTFVMEKVEPEARATVASLVSMANSFGWAFSPSISGWLQVNYGFGPVFAGVLLLYSVSVYMYWKFFWNAKPAQSPAPAPAD
ncbi:MAG: major facilitator superfamily permease [Anaerolineaceae bacterium]|nr:MAG: major facilitator superfamily permease [Anaerolineaceae bacterium]